MTDSNAELTADFSITAAVANSAKTRAKTTYEALAGSTLKWYQSLVKADNTAYDEGGVLHTTAEKMAKVFNLTFPIESTKGPTQRMMAHHRLVARGNGRMLRGHIDVKTGNVEFQFIKVNKQAKIDFELLRLVTVEKVKANAKTAAENAKTAANN